MPCGCPVVALWLLIEEDSPEKAADPKPAEAKPAEKKAPAAKKALLQKDVDDEEDPKNSKNTAKSHL